jgi:hypothetical protein
MAIILIPMNPIWNDRKRKSRTFVLLSVVGEAKASVSEIFSTSSSSTVVGTVIGSFL